MSVIQDIMSLLAKVEYCILGDTIALTDENAYDELVGILEEKGIRHRKNENSYAGIHMIELIHEGRED